MTYGGRFWKIIFSFITEPGAYYCVMSAPLSLVMSTSLIFLGKYFLSPFK